MGDRSGFAICIPQIRKFEVKICSLGPVVFFFLALLVLGQMFPL